MIILIVQQNYFSDLYSAKILNLSAKPFFPCYIYLHKYMFSAIKKLILSGSLYYETF